MNEHIQMIRLRYTCVHAYVSKVFVMDEQFV